MALDAPYGVLHPHPEVVQHLVVGCEWSIIEQTKQHKKCEWARRVAGRGGGWAEGGRGRRGEGQTRDEKRGQEGRAST